jgi:hypothetical protein
VSELEEIARRHGRVVTAAVLERAGIDRNALARLRRQGLLVRLFHRTYAVPPVVENDFALACRGAIAYAGAGSVLAGETALASVSSYPRPDLIDVAAPRERGVRSTPGLRVAASSAPWLAYTTTPGGVRTQRPEVAVLFAWARQPTLADARAVVCAAVAARAVTAFGVHAAVTAFPRLRRRAALLDTCALVARGCESPAEIEYLTEVEQRYGLPTGDRQAVIAIPGGRTRRVDVRYGDVVVEIDGGAHRTDARIRADDAVRDVVLTALGLRVLRFTAAEIATAPGLVAATVRATLADARADARSHARRASVS